MGLDIGTQSVGIACTDENYKLLRAKGHDMWAVRLFDEANDASSRRTKRNARRRLARRKQRIDFLQDIFAPFIEDKLFFIRLNNSGFAAEDKTDESGESLNTAFSLFDGGYNDMDYHARYPTIFHLRNRLASAGGAGDLRLYYLALHHIIKYRGHFLFDAEAEGGAGNIADLFNALNRVSEEQAFEADPVYLPAEKAEKFVETALDKKQRIYDKRKEAVRLFGFTNKREEEFITLVLGGTAKTAVIFGEDFAEKYENATVSFKNLKDEEFDALSASYDAGHFAFLQAARAIYNFLLLKTVLGGETYVSKAMINIYEKHKSDLKLLKRLIKDCCPDKYYKVFRSVREKANYANYIGYSKLQRKKLKAKKCAPEDFFKFIKNTVKQSCCGELADYVLSEIENGGFLPKILNADNGLFPHQINGAELNAILDNLCADYPAFAQKADGETSPAEKIKKLFNFRIPYYVGPLNNLHEESGNSWVVKKEGKVTPFNYDETVDERLSNEKFIRRMTNKCTYLHGKDVLPKHSLIYQKFNVLNQLNKWRINEQPISLELKKQIFEGLFKECKKATKASVRKWLVANGHISCEQAKTLSLTGFDGEIAVGMSSYVLLKSILGCDWVDSHMQACEDIVLWHTVNADKSAVEKCIEEKYGEDKFLISKIKEIKGISSFKEFGSLSKELLCSLGGGINPETGAEYTILGELYNTNKNFNEILYDGQYSFLDAIAEANGADGEVNLRAVEEMRVSPAVKRGIWQSLLMADECVRAAGRQPDKIFIEVTRADGEKKRTVSRRNKLFDLYKELDKDCAEYAEVTEKLNRTDETALRSERLYLYFLQLGKCAYSGKTIDLELLDTDLYDVDHIMPRSLVKDDGLDNKVLVLRELNARKSDKYPVPEDFASQRNLWALLHIKGLMSDKKYNLLSRVAPLSEDDLRDFVNRQIVITNQTVKAVAELLKRKYKGSKIVYSKAKNVDDFKQKFSIVKCRDTNDLHHARDAYLNIAVGNVYDVKFTRAMDYLYRKDDFYRLYNLEKLFLHDTDGAWNAERSLSAVLATVAKPSMCVTAYTYTEQGAFYNETIYGADDENIKAPRKQCAPYTDTAKYGGYKGLNPAHFTIIGHRGKKGERVVAVEPVPVLEFYKMGKSAGETEEKLLTYFKGQGFIQPEIIMPVLKIKSLIRVNGFYARIAGFSGAQLILHNAVQWFSSRQTDLYVKNIVKLNNALKDGKLSEEKQNAPYFEMVKSSRWGTTLRIDRDGNLRLYNEIIEKLGKCYGDNSAVKTFRENLITAKEAFTELTVLKQAQTLAQAIRFLKCNAELSDLSLIGLSRYAGTIKINRDITDKEFYVIRQSPCGFSERRVKI